LATPNITLTATLLDYSGNELGSATQPAWLRVALCGYGAVLPCVVGTANLGRVSSWFVDIPYFGAPLTGGTAVKLWGNDQITPAGTYYAISILDTQKNVVQCGAYRFTGGPLTIDLSSAPQLVPPYGFDVDNLEYAPCSGAVPGTVYVAPSTVLAPAYNGVLLPEGLAMPTRSYTLGLDQQTITLNFTTESGDLIYALCIS
jgi:hypothetical protein